MPATLTLPASKKVRELLRKTYETKLSYEDEDTGLGTHETDECCLKNHCIPLPDFSEIIRLVPSIIKAKGWEEGKGTWPVQYEGKRLMLARRWSMFYMDAPSPEEGMRLISEEILKLV